MVMNYLINKGVDRPLEFRGIQAQYLMYLGLGCLGLLFVFAVLYLAGINSFLAMGIVLIPGGCMFVFIKGLSDRYGAHGMMKRLARRKMPDVMDTTETFEKLPIEAVRENISLSRLGGVTLGYKVQLPEAQSLSSEQHEALHQTLVRALRSLPPNVIVHKQDSYAREHFASRDTNGDQSFLASASDRHFFERPYMRHSCSMFFTQCPEGRPMSTSATSNFLRSSLVPVQVVDPAKFKSFQDSVGQAIRILEDSGMVHVDRKSVV